MQNRFFLVLAEGFDRSNPSEVSVFTKAAIRLGESQARQHDGTLLVHREVATHPQGLELFDRVAAEMDRMRIGYDMLPQESTNALTDARATFDYLQSKSGQLQLTLVCYNPEVLLHQLRLYRRVLKYEYPELWQRLGLWAIAATDVPAVRPHEAWFYRLWASAWRLCWNRRSFKLLAGLYTLVTRGRDHAFVGTFTPNGPRK
jgi:hypothetical protein